MRWWTIAIAVASCDRAEPRARAPSNTAPVVTRYCPSFDRQLGPWVSELFPACPPPDIGVDLPVCVGACPRPCGARFTSWSSPEPSEERFERDARGRWVATRTGRSEVRCRYRDDQLDACTWYDKRMHAERDARGRLIAIANGDGRVAIAYDAQGRVVRVGDTTLGYDDRGYLIAVGSLALEVDARGRVAATTLPAVATAPSPGDEHTAHDDSGELDLDSGPAEPEVTTYTYHGDRLIEVETHATFHHTTIGYDAQGRVARVTTSYPASPMEVSRTHTLLYDDCR